MAWAPPAGIMSQSIDIATGKLAAGFCGESRREWFRDGTAPTETCEASERIAMLDMPDPPDPPEPPEAPEMQASRALRHDLSAAVRAAINAIDDPRGRRAARRIFDELRRAAERDQRERDARERGARGRD